MPIFNPSLGPGLLYTSGPSRARGSVGLGGPLSTVYAAMINRERQAGEDPRYEYKGSASKAQGQALHPQSLSGDISMSLSVHDCTCLTTVRVPVPVVY